jgi:hypothetical protein
MRNITHKIVGLGSSFNDDKRVEYLVRVPIRISRNCADARTLALKHLSVINSNPVISSEIAKTSKVCFNIYIQVKD